MIERITDHVEQAKALLISQYRGKPKLEAWLASFVKQCQLLEDACWEVFDARLLDNATGKNLDTLGKLVGQPRKGDTDEEYRTFVRARIRANRSNGKRDELLGIARVLTDGKSQRLTEFYPAAVLLEFLDPLPTATYKIAIIARLLKAAAAAGVSLQIQYFETDLSATFTFADGDVEQFDADRGFADDAGTTGGQLTGVELGAT